MAKLTVAQQYLDARGKLEKRLGDIECELSEIRAALGLGGASKPAAKAGGFGGARQPKSKTGRRRRMKRGQALTSIMEFLNKNAPVKPKAVAVGTGVKDGTVSNALNNLQKQKLAGRTKTGWSLTKAGKAELGRRASGK